MKYVDLKLARSDDGGYDLIIGDFGDFTATEGLDTTVLSSILSDARASVNEVALAQFRGGWLGNLVPVEINRELGSLLWVLEQRRRTTENLNLSIDAVQKSLTWLIDQDVAKSVEVTGILKGEGAILTVIITSLSGEVDSIYVPLWKATVNGS